MILIRGTCYDDTNIAHNAIKSEFPIFATLSTGTSVIYYDRYLSSSTLTDSGLFTYSTKDQNGIVTQTNATIQLATCETPTLNELHLTVTIAFWFALIIGIIAGFGITKHKSTYNAS